MSSYRALYLGGKSKFFRKLLGVLIIVVLLFPYTFFMLVLVVISSIVQGVTLIIWGRVGEYKPSFSTVSNESLPVSKVDKPKPIIQEYIPQEEIIMESEKLIIELLHFPKNQNNILFAHSRKLDEELREREYFLKRREEVQAQEMSEARITKRELDVEKEMIRLEKKKAEILSMQNTSESERTEYLRQLKLEEEIIKKRRENNWHI